VINAGGTYIGRVADLLIDTENGKVKKMVLAAEDIRGQDSHVALSYEPTRFTTYGIVYDISPEEIKNSPSYSYEK
jgi:sporulation protein YlmC with PRC-barrel domain